MHTAFRASLASLVVVLPMVTASPEARGDPVENCVAAVASGQKLERAGHLRAARATLLSCDKSECPAEVRSVCDRLLNAVESSTPTVIFGARDSSGNDLVAVSLRVDGALVAGSMDGKAVPMDPGPHVLHFEHEGSAPIERSVVVREAEKNRSLIVTFPSPRAAVPIASSPAEGGPRRPVPALVYALGGVGVASLGPFIWLALHGQNPYASCQPRGCPGSLGGSLSAERDTTFAVAGLAVVSLGLATWLFFARPTEPRATTGLTFDVETIPGGGLLRAVGRF
jgi:hypothetical protein